MYPKNTNSGLRSGVTKKNFLNPYQREELRKRLTEKFTKLYGLSDPGQVKDCVDQFFSNNNECNAANLSKLEKEIKSHSQKTRSVVKPAGPLAGRREEDQISNAPSRQSGYGKLI